MKIIHKKKPKIFIVIIEKTTLLKLSHVVQICQYKFIFLKSRLDEKNRSLTGGSYFSFFKIEYDLMAFDLKYLNNIITETV
jgi:hypothetical protein